ncbi:MAG TPA: TldD/PmbA family protein [Candidatus Lokiarchaeia archaeon]|nr:TldD/PmbA family protein [Candidatus Lokiarchaeia archaeon]
MNHETMTRDDIDELAIKEKIERELARYRVKQHEVFMVIGTSLNIDVERGSLKTAEIIRDAGFGVRVANEEGQCAFSYTSRMDSEAIKKTIKNVVSTMGQATKDPDFHSFASESATTKISPSLIFDPEIENIEIDDAVQLVTATLDSARSIDDEHVYSINVSFKAGNTRVFVFNSNSIEISEDHTDVGLDCEVTVKDGDEMNSDYDFSDGRALSQVTTDVGARAVYRALKTLGKVSVKSGFLPVVFSPRAAGYVVAGAVALAANAESIQQEMSFLGGKLGEKIAPDFLTIVDDPRLEAYSRHSTCSFDGEGSSTSTKKIVNAGILDTFLHDSYTANKVNVENTGNAARGSYDSPPHISPFNLIIAPDESSIVAREELLKGIEYGIYFDQTGDSPNMTTGDFSGMISSGFLIENGAITSPIEQATFGTNLLELLASIESFDDKPEDNAGTITPSIRLKGLHISGNQ